MPESFSEFLKTIWEQLAAHAVSFVLGVVVFVLILVIGKIVIGWLCGALNRSLQKSPRFTAFLRQFTVNVVGKVLWVGVFLVALQQLGVSVGPLVAGLGVTGFIIGFACQESLGNLAAGFMIALNQPFKEDDFVEIGGTTGVVKEMNMMCVTLHTPDNKKVVVPNSGVWGSEITNYTALDTRRIDMTVGVSYGADLGKTREVLQAVLDQTDGLLEDPAPTIEVFEMADSSVNFVVRPWCHTADYWPLYWKMQRAMKEALDAADIEIPFPQMDVHHHGLPPAPNAA